MAGLALVGEGAPEAPRPRAAGETATSDDAPTFPAGVELVTVDAVVADKKGMPVTGLSRDDFVVLEDGQPQTIESFTPVELAAATSPADGSRPRPSVSTNDPKDRRPGRTFGVLFDDANITRFRSEAARGAVARFLETGTGEGDQVVLASSSGDAWWSAGMVEGRAELGRLLDRLEGRFRPELGPERIAPWEAVRIHLYRDVDVAFRVQQRLRRYGVMPGADPRGAQPRLALDDGVLLSEATRVYLDTLDRGRRTLKVMDRMLAALASGRGRKSLVIVSEGFLHDPNVGEFRTVAESARRSNVVVYFVDARGLAGLPPEATAELGFGAQPEDLGVNYQTFSTLDQQLGASGPETIASESGGFSVRDTNDLASGIRRIAKESETYYLVGYRPTSRKKDAKFREIQVKVRRQGVTVRARKGYYAPSVGQPGAPSLTPPPDDPGHAFQPALDSPLPVAAIPLRMTALVFQETMVGSASTLVAVDVDVRGLVFEERDGRFVDDLEYILVLSHRETGESHRSDEKVALSLSAPTRKALESSWYTLTKTLELSPGGYQARFVVRDRNSGRIGSVMHDFEVPPLDAFRVSTPLVTDVVQQGENTPPRPVLHVRRTYSPDASLYCEFEVYGASKDETGGPRVTAGYSIRRADGTELVSVEPNAIVPSPRGRLSRLFTAALRGAAPGRYELVLTVRDDVARKNVVVREPFTIEAPKGT